MVVGPTLQLTAQTLCPIVSTSAGNQPAAFFTTRPMAKLNGHCRWQCEMTDTFGGEANYSWVKRGTTLVRDGSTRRSVVLAVKRELGLTGTRCHTTDHGDMVEMRPVGSCTVAFATIEY